MSDAATAPDALSSLIEANSVSVAQYKNDILAKANDKKIGWIAYLGVAPLCLELLAMCNLTAARKDAQGIELKITKTYKSEHIKQGQYLTTALIAVGNEGRTAFDNANKRMTEINSYSTNVKSNVTTILRLLINKKTDVRHELNALGVAADKCKELAEQMDLDFAKWNDLVKDLHDAVSATDESNAVEYRITLSNESSRKVEKEAWELMVKNQEADIKKREEDVQEMKTLVKEELEKYPTGQELMKMDILQNLGNAAANLINVVGSVAGSIAANRFGGGINSNNNDSKNDNGNDKDASGTDGETKKDVINDPANMYCPFVLSDLQELYNIVHGSKGVSWDLITNTDLPKGDRRRDLTSVDEALKRRRSELEKKKATKKSKVGKKLLEALQTAEAVVRELKEEKSDSLSLNVDWKAPDEKSPKVTKWKADVKECRKTVKTLDTKAKASSTATQPINITTLGVPSVPKGQSASQTALKAHTYRVETSRKLYELNIQRADRAKEVCLDLQKNLITIRSDLENLTNTKLTLEKVKVVLRDCLSLLVHLKDNISRLRIFFTKLSAEVKSVVDMKVTPFSGRVDDIMKSPDLLIDLITLQVYTADIWAGFDLYKDVSAFYMNVHTSYILDGLHLMDRMTLRGGDDQAAQYKEIKDYSNKSQEGIAKLIDAETTKIKEKLGKNVQRFNKALEAAEVAQRALPPIDDQEPDHEADSEAIDAAKKEDENELNNNTAALNYLTLPLEERNKRKDELEAATNPQTLLQQAQKDEAVVAAMMDEE